MIYYGTWNIKISHLCALILDISAAFDTVDHSVLLEVLNKRYGMGGMANDWFASYLSPRFCKISIQDAYSTPRELTFSVPQGSIAGASLYTYYASTLQDVIPSDIDIHGYADDHGIKKSYQANDKLGEVYVKAFLSQCMNDVNGWMDSNRLKLNNSETEFAAFASGHYMEKVNDAGLGRVLDKSTRVQVQVLEKMTSTSTSTSTGFSKVLEYKYKYF